MPALGFMKQFAPYIENGTKRHTVRAARKYPIKAGDQLRLYVGMRTKECRMLRDWTPCLAVQKIEIICGESVRIGETLMPEWSNDFSQFVWADGFRKPDDDIREDDLAFWGHFFKPLVPVKIWTGVLISWLPHPFINL